MLAARALPFTTWACLPTVTWCLIPSTVPLPSPQVETRATGVEREIPGGEVEHLGTTERVVAVTPPKAPCE